MSNATIAERRERYHKAQGKRGLVEVRVWVPESRRDELRGLARLMREDRVDREARARQPRKAR